LTRSEQNSRRKINADNRCKRLKVGDYVRFRDRHCPIRYAGKIAQIVEWHADGFNNKRAPRNKKVIFAIEPHIHDSPETYMGKLQEVIPVTEMEVLAEASQ
jgi:hypothetical protein